MAQKNNPFSKIQLVLHRSTPRTKIAVLAAVVLSIIAMMSLRSTILNANEQLEALRSQAAVLDQENKELDELVDDMDSVEGITRIAQEELGLVDPDTIIFQPEP